jgi:hypothetical protein
MKVLRVLTRVHVAPGRLDDAVTFYKITEPPKRVPTGSNMRVRHPDGTVVEYVEHDG